MYTEKSKCFNKNTHTKKGISATDKKPFYFLDKNYYSGQKKKVNGPGFVN